MGVGEGVGSTKEGDAFGLGVGVDEGSAVSPSTERLEDLCEALLSSCPLC